MKSLNKRILFQKSAEGYVRRIAYVKELCHRTIRAWHVTIGAVEKYITDLAWENGWVRPIEPSTDLDLTVGIIGAGPGGLAAAERLRGAGLKFAFMTLR